MNYSVKDLTTLYEEIIKILDETPINVEMMGIFVNTLRQQGETLTSGELIKLCDYLVGRFPYLGYITEELLKINASRETVKLDATEIKFYVTLVKHYKKNEQRFI